MSREISTPRAFVVKYQKGFLGSIYDFVLIGIEYWNVFSVFVRERERERERESKEEARQKKINEIART